ncbi:MAG: hypothetical protein HY755_01805 [Nitrospirae bacterium]|nr:hypothetical protein [Nitrospirota bacterium]
MKRIVIAFVIILILPIICFSYDYDVSGTDSDGNQVSGNIEVDQNGGDGYIETDEGEEKHIDVDWTGKGKLEGYDEDGNYYELEVE